MKTLVPLEVQELGMSFGGRTIFHSVSFAVPAGSSLALIGRSGSGKSTILACILGLQKPEAGRVLVNSQNVAGLSRAGQSKLRREQIGMVFQSSELLDSLTALENTTLPALIGRRSAGMDMDVNERGRELLNAVGLEDRNTLASDLSGGERQRVALARALMNEPSVLLADEPTGSLDTGLRDAAADLLFSAARNTKAALLVVTHDPAVADRADAVLSLD